MLAGLYVTLKSVFGGVEVVPGERYLFMAGSGKIDPAILAHRLAERGVHTQYVRPEFFKERLSSRRMQQARDLVVDVKGVINTDLRPSAMIDALAYQSTRTGSRFSSVVEVFRTFAIWLWLLPAGVFLLARRKRGTTGAALVTAGFCQMLLQTGMLIMFQAVFGNVYVLLGGLMALFMLGLACGAWRSPVKRALSRAALSGAAVLVLAAALAPIVVAYKSWAAIYFCVVPLLAGYCGGWLFRAVLRQSGSAGQAYALDVVGAAPGALLGGILLIPLWGLPLALAFAGVLQLAVFLAQD